MDKGILLKRAGQVTFSLKNDPKDASKYYDLVLKPGANRVKPDDFALLEKHALFVALSKDKLIEVQDITPAEGKVMDEKAAKSLREMTKQDLVIFAQKELDLELSMNETKEDLIAQIEEAQEASN